MDKKKKVMLWFGLIWTCLLLLTVGGITYAWFTFQPYTLVEPVSGTVTGGETSLLIASSLQGEFAESCVLESSVSTGLKPVSTANLTRFYTAARQNRQGITDRFADATDLVEENCICGSLYLKSFSENCSVYFYLENMDFGVDAQALAALRLGLRFTTEEDSYVYIFNLEDMADVRNAEKVKTVSEDMVVVSDIDSQGRATFVPDPSRRISDYSAKRNEAEPESPLPGKEALCVLNSNEVGKVEYWLYLEGCDENCINEVQGREAFLQLSFAGVTLSP